MKRRKPIRPRRELELTVGDRYEAHVRPDGSVLMVIPTEPPGLDGRAVHVLEEWER